MLAKARVALIGGLILLLLQSVPGAQTIQPLSVCITAPGGGQASTPQACIQSAMIYVVIGLMLSFQIVAISYLIGEVFKVNSFKGWYKGELYESVKSLAIAGAIFAVIIIFGAIANSVTGTVCPNGLSCLMTQATSYLTAQVSQSNDAFYGTLGISLGLSYMTSLSFQEYVPFVSQIPIIIPPAPAILGSINFGADLNLFQTSVLSASNKGNILGDTVEILIVPIAMLVALQAYLLPVLMVLGLGVFLPLGIILRAIPFLRFIGGSFIGLAIGLAVIYPAVMVFVNAPITNYLLPSYQNVEAAASYCPSIGLCPIARGALSFLNPTLLVFATLPLDQLSYMTAGYDGAVAAFFNGNMMFVLNPLFAFSMPMATQFLLLILDLTVVYIGSQNIAKMLGGSIRLGIGKLSLK